MFGWMEGVAAFGLQTVELAVVPTVVLPFAVLSVAASGVATFVAALFGVELRWEGPKRLLEVLLKPRVLLSALALNVFLLGALWLYRDFQNTPSWLLTVRWKNSSLQKEFAGVGENRTYTPWTQRTNVFAPPVADRRLLGVTQTWRTKLPQGVFGGAALSGTSLFAGSDDGHVYELSQDDGAVLRKFYIGTAVSPEPVIWNEFLFAGEGLHDTHHARIYKFHLKTGEFLGAFASRGHTQGVPSIVSFENTPLLFVIAGVDGIYAVNPNTMEKRWHRGDIGHVDGEVRVVGSRVFISSGVEKGTGDKFARAYALDFHTGVTLWKAELPASGWMPPLVTETDVCWGLGEIYLSSSFGQFACYDQKHGVPRQSITMDAPLLGIPLYLKHSVIVSDLQGQVCALQWPNGWRRWCHQTFSKTYASGTSDGWGHLLYPSAKDGLHILDLFTGRTWMNWKPSAEEGAWGTSYSRVTIGADGGWFLTDLDGNIRKLQPRYEEKSTPVTVSALR